MNNAIKTLTFPKIEINLRKDLYSKFDGLLKDLFKNAGLNVFHHTIIRNYREPGHKVSSFFSNEEWSETYWTKFYDDDPVERACHRAARQVGIGLSSWQVLDPTSECMETRTTICKARDGILMGFQHDGLIENMAFGWEKFDTDSLNPARIELLNKLIAPLRQYHLSTHGL